MTKSIQKTVVASSLIGGLAFAPFPIRLQPIRSNIGANKMRLGFWGSKLKSNNNGDPSSSEDTVFMDVEEDNLIGTPTMNRPNEMQIKTEIDGIPTSSTYMFSSSTSSRTSNIDVSETDIEDESSSTSEIDVDTIPLPITQIEAGEQQVPPSESVTPKIIDDAETDLVAAEKELLAKEQKLRLELENQIKEEQRLIEQQEALRKELLRKAEEEKRLQEEQRLKREEEKRRIDLNSAAAEEEEQKKEEERLKKEEERLKKEDELLRLEFERIAQEQKKQDEETNLSKESFVGISESSGDQSDEKSDTGMSANVAGFSNSMPGAQVVKYTPPPPNVPQNTGFSSFDIMKTSTVGNAPPNESGNDNRSIESKSPSKRDDEFTFGAMSQTRKESKKPSSSSKAGFSGQPPGSGDVTKYSPPTPSNTVKGVVNPMGGGIAESSSQSLEESMDNGLKKRSGNEDFIENQPNTTSSVIQDNGEVVENEKRKESATKIISQPSMNAKESDNNNENEQISLLNMQGKQDDETNINFEPNQRQIPVIRAMSNGQYEFNGRTFLSKIEAENSERQYLSKLKKENEKFMNELRQKRYQDKKINLTQIKEQEIIKIKAQQQQQQQQVQQSQDMPSSGVPKIRKIDDERYEFKGQVFRSKEEAAAAENAFKAQQRRQARLEEDQRLKQQQDAIQQQQAALAQEQRRRAEDEARRVQQSQLEQNRLRQTEEERAAEDALMFNGQRFSSVEAAQAAKNAYMSQNRRRGQSSGFVEANQQFRQEEQDLRMQAQQQQQQQQVQQSQDMPSSGIPKIRKIDDERYEFKGQVFRSKEEAAAAENAFKAQQRNRVFSGYNQVSSIRLDGSNSYVSSSKDPSDASSLSMRDSSKMRFRGDVDTSLTKSQFESEIRKLVEEQASSEIKRVQRDAQRMIDTATERESRLISAQNRNLKLLMEQYEIRLAELNEMKHNEMENERSEVERLKNEIKVLVEDQKQRQEVVENEKSQIALQVKNRILEEAQNKISQIKNEADQRIALAIQKEATLVSSQNERLELLRKQYEEKLRSIEALRGDELNRAKFELANVKDEMRQLVEQQERQLEEIGEVHKQTISSIVSKMDEERKSTVQSLEMKLKAEYANQIDDLNAAIIQLNSYISNASNNVDADNTEMQKQLKYSYEQKISELISSHEALLTKVYNDFEVQMKTEQNRFQEAMREQERFLKGQIAELVTVIDDSKTNISTLQKELQNERIKSSDLKAELERFSEFMKQKESDDKKQTEKMFFGQKAEFEQQLKSQLAKQSELVKQLENQLTAAENEITTKSQLLNDATSKLSQLALFAENANKNLDQERNAQKEAIEKINRLTKAATQSASQIQKLEYELSQMSDEHAALVRKLTSDYDEIVREKDGLSNALNIAKRETDELKRRSDMAKRDNSLVSSLERELDSSRQSMKRKEEEILQLRELLSSSQTKEENVKSELQKIQSELNNARESQIELKNAMRISEATIQDLKNDILSKNSQIENFIDMESNLRRSESEASAKEISSLTMSLKEYQNKNNELAKEIESQRGILFAAEAMQRNLTLSLNDKASVVDNLTLQVENLNLKALQLEMEKNEINLKLQNTLKEADDAKIAIEQSDRVIDSKESTISSLSKEIEILKTKIASKEARMAEESRRKMNDLKERIFEEKNRLSGEKERLATKRDFELKSFNSAFPGEPTSINESERSKAKFSRKNQEPRLKMIDLKERIVEEKNRLSEEKERLATMGGVNQKLNMEGNAEVKSEDISNNESEKLLKDGTVLLPKERPMSSNKTVAITEENVTSTNSFTADNGNDNIDVFVETSSTLFGRFRNPFSSFLSTKKDEISQTNEKNTELDFSGRTQRSIKPPPPPPPPPPPIIPKIIKPKLVRKPLQPPPPPPPPPPIGKTRVKSRIVQKSLPRPPPPPPPSKEISGTIVLEKMPASKQRTKSENIVSTDSQSKVRSLKSRLAEEQMRLIEENKRIERGRLEKLRIAEEEKQQREIQLAKEKKLKEEKDARLAEQSRLAEEQKKEQERLEKLRIAEEEKQQREIQLAKEKKLKEEKDARLAEQSRLAEEQKKEQERLEKLRIAEEEKQQREIQLAKEETEQQGVIESINKKMQPSSGDKMEQLRRKEAGKPFFLSPAIELDVSVANDEIKQNIGKIEVANVKENNLKDSMVNEQTQQQDAIAINDTLQQKVDLDSLVHEIKEMASSGNWDNSRTLMKMIEEFQISTKEPVASDIYIKILEACLLNDLHEGKASMLVCDLLEQMVNAGYSIPSPLGSDCIETCLGTIKSEGGVSGGIDTALKMFTAISRSPEGLKSLSMDSIGTMVSALSADDQLEEAVRLLRKMIDECALTPPLATFADVASAATRKENDSEKVLETMMLLKSSGYLIDDIASTQAGRNIISSGVIAAEQMNNVELGLGLLASASKAKDCKPDSGDVLVASFSPTTKKACFNIHQKAIDDAVKSESWVLAIKLISLMIKRNLNPTNDIWEGVVDVCAQNNKSKESASILLDWVKRAGQGEANIPPISIFDTVLATCEKCGETALAKEILAVKESI